VNHRFLPFRGVVPTAFGSGFHVSVKFGFLLVRSEVLRVRVVLVIGFWKPDFRLVTKPPFMIGWVLLARIKSIKWPMATFWIEI